MATDPVLAGKQDSRFHSRQRSSGPVGQSERMPASQPAVQRRGAGATRMQSHRHRHSGQTGQPYMCDSAGLEARSTRQTGASNDSSPSPPFPSETKVKSDSFGSAAAYRHRQTNNAENATDNRKIAIVPPLKVDKSTQDRAKGDETAQHLPSVPGAIQATLPSPLAGCRQKLVVDAQLAASGPALVAPPDTTNQVSLPDIYSSLTPSSPSSSTSLSPTTQKLPHSPSSSEPEKSRAARSRGHSRTPSRDVGIVGTLTRRELPQDLATVQDAASDYQPPIFQTPSSRSSSPDTTSTSVHTTSLESKSIAQTASSGQTHVRPTAMSASVEPIHNAHVMNGHGIHTQPHSTHPLDTSLPHAQLVGNPEQSRASPAPSSSSSVSAAPSSYVHYQPGVHSKAGPLPPPPRAMFDIDFTAPPPPRPPRRRSPSPLTSQNAPGVVAPASVTVRLASKVSTASVHQIHISATPPLSTQSSSEDSDYSPEPEPGPTSPVHQREGAFPPSKILVTPAERGHSLPDKSIKLAPEVPAKDELPKSPVDILESAPVIIVQPVKDEPAPSTARPPELRRETSWISNSNDSSHVSSAEGSRHAFEDARPRALNRSSSSIRESATEDSPPEPKRKGGVLTNLKRYSSLPRPPSVKSPRTSVFPRTPSPPLPSPPKPRIRARSPDAMRFKDILNKKSTLERATAYAKKINELSMYDCGLGDWVTTTKERGGSKTRLVASPPQSPDDVLDPRPRNPSRSSLSSEMTFPLRADAYIATDLSQRDIDTVPSPNVPPPALPYPALAGVPPPINSRSTNTAIGAQLSHSPSLSVGAKVTAGLLSSLGRNASMRKDMSKPTEKLTRSATRSAKPSLTSLPNPRPVQITNAPSVPGGPRALPGRVQRSQTLMLSSSPTNSGNNPSTSLLMRRRSNTLKRPSFFGRSPGPSPELDTPTNTEFTRQVERLADLLPHADKNVLAGYLSRAGQDILAIGQYLEDEKNGNLRRQ